MTGPALPLKSLLSGQPHRVSLAQSDQLQILDYSPRPVKLRGEIVSFHHLSQASFIQYDIMYGYIQKYYELKESLLGGYF